MLLLTGKSAWNKKININLSHPFCPLTYAPEKHLMKVVQWHTTRCLVMLHSMCSTSVTREWPVIYRCHIRKDPLIKVDLQDEYSHLWMRLYFFPVYLIMFSRMILTWHDPHLTQCCYISLKSDEWNTLIFVKIHSIFELDRMLWKHTWLSEGTWLSRSFPSVLWACYLICS